MGQQVAFIILIVLAGMIFFQILLLAKNEKKRLNTISHDLNLLKEKLGIK